jgi:superfamily II DNA/RNA helicase
LSFTDLSLHPLLLKALEMDGYDQPTPIQEAAIPPAMEGRDLLATAQTGTGKTAGFLLPSLHRIAENRLPRPAGQPRILVLAPTRELAQQVLMAARKHAKFMKLNIIDIVGGMPYHQQLRMLARPVDVVVATPGRLIDHLERARLDLSRVETLILDEADRMLDMGFLDDVKAVAAACAGDRQTLLFTATLDRRMAELAEGLLRDPVRVSIAPSEVTTALIEQRLHHADDLHHKRKLLHHFANLDEVGKAIIFTATKRDADALAQDLEEAGHAVRALHGDMTQRERNRTLQALRNGQIRLLVATDVAARGIDVKDISHVINFDLPRQPEDYVHRIGRTGRAGAQGTAISFAGPADRGVVYRIQQYTKATMDVHLVPGLEPRRPANSDRPAAKKKNFKPWGAKPNGGQRFDGPRGDGHRKGNAGGKPFHAKKAAGARG